LLLPCCGLRPVEQGHPRFLVTGGSNPRQPPNSASQWEGWQQPSYCNGQKANEFPNGPRACSPSVGRRGIRQASGSHSTVRRTAVQQTRQESAPHAQKGWHSRRGSRRRPSCTTSREETPGKLSGPTDVSERLGWLSPARKKGGTPGRPAPRFMGPESCRKCLQAADRVLRHLVGARQPEMRFGHPDGYSLTGSSGHWK
jgi:hypothetical protein